MSKVARAFSVLLVAVFALSTVAHAVGASSMGAAMALAGTADGGAPCKTCPVDDVAQPGCKKTCVAPSLMAAPMAAVAMPAAFAVAFAGTCAGRQDGVPAAPDPNPPRAFIPA